MRNILTASPLLQGEVTEPERLMDRLRIVGIQDHAQLHGQDVGVSSIKGLREGVAATGY
jgi:hypothetical protein